MMKKIPALLISSLIFITVMGCSNDTGNNAGNNSGDVYNSGIYYVNEHLSAIPMDEILAFASFEENLILTGITQGYISGSGDTGDFYGQTVKTLVIDQNGNLISDTVLFRSSDDPYKIPAAASVDDSGNIWLLFRTYTYHEQAQIMEYQNSTFECYDSSGKLMSSITPELTDFSETVNIEFTISDDSIIYIFADGFNGGTLYVINMGGMLLFEVDRIEGMRRLPDGRVIVKRSNMTGEIMSFYEVDVEKAGLGAQYPLESTDTDFDAVYVSGNGNYDMLESTATALYGCNPENGTRTMLVDWRSQGVYNSPLALYRQVIITGDDIYCLESPARGDISLIKLRRTDTAPETAEKTVITIGALQDYGLGSAVNGFKRQHPDVDVQIKIYNTPGAEYIDNITAFNLDLIAGYIPDIIYVTPSMQIESLVKKGLFADLYEFMDNDPDISREDFVPGILKAFETEGRLYTMVDTFYVTSVAGRVSDVGEDMGWTWDEFNALMAEQPDGTIPISAMHGAMARDEFLSWMLTARLTDFVDYSAGKCCFDSLDFISLLEMTARYYPADANYSITPQDFHNGNPKLIYVINSGQLNYNGSTLYEGYLGEKSTFAGFPTATGTGGSKFRFDNRIAISETSENKDIAWEFLKYILTDYQHKNDYQTDRPLNGFSVRIDELESEAEFWYGEYYPTWGEQTFESNGLVMRVPEEDDIRQILDLIYSIDSYEAYDFVIDAIVSEEAAAFFTGSKSAHETAAAIQNRAGIYMAEMS